MLCAARSHQVPTKTWLYWWCRRSPFWGTHLQLQKE